MLVRPEILAAILVLAPAFAAEQARGASLLQNGVFEATLNPWTIEGTAGNTGDTAVLSDAIGSRVAVFQTTSAPANFAGFQIHFDFIGGLSPTVSPGFVLDTFFATVYLGLNDFGASIGGGNFSQSIDLFSLDANGIFDVAAGGAFGPSPKGAGWSRFSLTRLTAPGFTDPGFLTVAFEFFNLNGTQGDSVVAVDNVELLAVIPEPAAGALLGLALAIMGGLRRRGSAAAPN